MKKSNKQEVLEWIKAVVIAAVFVLAMRTFIFSPILVDGASMMPTYENGDRVIVNKFNTDVSDLHRFDVIVFEASTEADYIKRIIGLPGDHIAYQDDILYVNGKPLEEPYLQREKEKLQHGNVLTQDFTLEQLTGYSAIPEGYFFVLGDNRTNSSDSRDRRVGLVSIDSVLGTADIRFYPFDKLGVVK